jgi:hypothetical protein
VPAPWEIFVGPKRVGGFVVPSEHDVRERASICQDCWFWKEMSCALASPENGVCANRRPVRGRRLQTPTPPQQASLVPLADGHAAQVQAPAPQPMQPAARAPFGETAPEATFSLAQVREPVPAAVPRPARTPMADIAQRVRTSPPSFREIRAAAAASRAPMAQVTIPVAEVEGGTLTQLARREAAAQQPQQGSLPGMDQLVERVRQRAAQRLSRLGNATAHSA